MNIQPGDIAASIRELSVSAKFCRDAAISYAGHPAADDMARAVNQQRVDAANARADGFERVMALLASVLLDRQKPAHKETSP